MHVDADVAELLAETRVLEMSVVAGDGGPNVYPMAGAWIPETEQIILTTPLAYAQKAEYVRRDGRVSLLYSDLTGSGLSATTALLVQGTASVPDVIAAPQDIPGYWRELLRRNPGMADDFATEEDRNMLDWYYLRVPFFVTPERFIKLEVTKTGGAWEPPAPGGAALAGQVADALRRYSSAVFASRDHKGHPYAARAEVTAGGAAGELLVRTPDDFAGRTGPASLLWHRHNGDAGDMSALQVKGVAVGSGREWRFSAERIPGWRAVEDQPSSMEGWIEEARQRTDRYIQRHGLAPAEVDWSALTAVVPAG